MNREIHPEFLSERNGKKVCIRHCSNAGVNSNNSNTRNGTHRKYPYTVTLWAGQNIDVGTVSVWNDSENLYVKYEATDNWYFTETHLHVATALENIPQTKKGNPIPGHFDYPMEYDPPVQENTNVINLEDCGFEVGDNLYIAAHAVVQKDVQEETAWGAGDNFLGKNWAMYFTYVVQIEQSIPD